VTPIANPFVVGTEEGRSVPRAGRIDAVGRIHHVMNRGIARRTMFETRRDCRKFLACLAREVRAGRIAVLAYCVMSTHFHLLVRSLQGEISSVMQRVQNDYARWFNRGRKRDGPLHRARFTSKVVDNDEYLFNVVRYIDFNPVQAGLAESPALYPFGSAHAYARLSGPRWLARAWMEKQLRSPTHASEYDPAQYARLFGDPISPALSRVIERRLQFRRGHEDPLDDLLAASGVEVEEWMKRKASLADGTTAGIPVCDSDLVSEFLEERARTEGEWPDPSSQRRIDAWAQVHAALLRDLCGATRIETAIRLGQSERAVGRALVRHRRSLFGSAPYASRVSELAQAALGFWHRGTDATPAGSCSGTVQAGLPRLAAGRYTPRPVSAALE
jgi:REP element-mobilizing transposase RayT